MSDEDRRKMDYEELASAAKENRLSYDDVNLITTKHYYYGFKIIKLWRENAARKAEQKRSQQQLLLHKSNTMRSMARTHTGVRSSMETLDKVGRQVASNEELEIVIKEEIQKMKESQDEKNRVYTANFLSYKRDD